MKPLIPAQRRDRIQEYLIRNKIATNSTLSSCWMCQRRPSGETWSFWKKKASWSARMVVQYCGEHSG
jgi:hypothetical protein